MLPLPPQKNNQPVQLTLKEVKTQGKIGNPGQKDKLTFPNLNYQIENGLKI